LESICDGCKEGWAKYDGATLETCMDKECHKKKGRRIECAKLFGSWVESGDEDKHFSELRG